jgi:multiple sugar transport system substrate-binding protein
MHLMSTMAKGSSFYSADGTTCDFGSANATTVLQAAVNWGKANIGPGAITADSSGCNTRLINGRSAMIMQGEWIVGPLMTGSTTGGPVSNIADFVLGPAPVLGSYRVSETYFSQGFVMSAGSKVKDAAWKLVEYFFGPKGADERAKIGWGEPGLKSAFQYFPKTGAAAEWYNSTQTEAKYFATMPYSPYASSDDVNSVMLNEIANVILGKETLAQAQANMTSQVNAKLAAGKASLLG